MQYYLATTGISQIWDKDKKLLLLGPWCSTGEDNKKILKTREYHVVPSPWKPAYKIKEAADYCYSIYEGLLPLLAKKLNSMHEVSFSEAYWQVLIGPWLLFFIEIFYERYRRIENCAHIFSDFYTHALPIEKCDISVTNTSDFMDNKIDGDFYNFKLFSIIARNIFPQYIKELDYDYQTTEGKKDFIVDYSWKGKIFTRLLEKISLILKDQLVLTDMYHVSYSDMFLFKLREDFKGAGFLNFNYLENHLTRDYCLEARKALFIEDAKDGFYSLLCRTLAYAIPICYVEKYRLYRESIKKYLNSVKVIGSAVGWYFNERFKFFAAEAKTKGAKLIDFQHGGNYGMYLSMSYEKMSLQKDVFFTWGWTSSGADKIQPLPSAHLSRLKDSYRRRCDKVLFIGMNMPRYHYIFSSWLFPEDMTKYIEDKKTLLKALTDKIRHKILYRPYFIDFGWQEKIAIEEACPAAEFLVEGRAVDLMRKVKLVIVDHPHTSFLEALTINVPSIFYWNPEIYLMRTEAEPYFDILKEAGILFYDPVNAAKKVNYIYEDPLGWWLNDSVQNARLKFCEQFALARKDWKNLWAREFKKLKC